MDLSFCQSENGFSQDELVIKPADVYERKALEASRQHTVSSALNPEVRTDLIQMSKNFPEQFFRHTCIK